MGPHSNFKRAGCPEGRMDGAKPPRVRVTVRLRPGENGGDLWAASARPPARGSALPYGARALVSHEVPGGGGGKKDGKQATVSQKCSMPWLYI